MAELIMEESMAQVFRTETSEQLQRMADIFLELDHHPNNQSEVIHELFRLAHNIKGSSGMMELTVLQQLMHSLEDIFNGVRNGNAELSPEQIGMVLELLGDLQEYIHHIDAWDQVDGLTLWQERLQSRFRANPEASAGRPDSRLVLTAEEKREVAAWQEAGKSVYGIEVEYAADCMLPAAAAMVFIQYLARFGTVYKTAPAAEAMMQTQWERLRVVLMVETELSEAGLAEISGYRGHGETEVQVRKWTIRKPEPVELKIPHETDDVIRVDYRKIEQLMENLEELIRMKTALSQQMDSGKTAIDERDIDNALFHMDQLIRTLQGDIMNLGMVPARQLFSRFPMVIRDLSRKSGKAVELEVSGESTELDKRIIEQLVLPLTHLVRNAVDHGIEPAEERCRLGKPEQGKVTLAAAQEGETIVIRVQDDGRGLDLERIRAKAINKGLIDPTDDLTGDEISQLIFKPGFSTADQVTDISGRGVGMDVVKSQVEALKGTIAITTRSGEGTVFSLRLPLTQAIVAAFFIRAGGRCFGVPLGEVVESMLMESRPRPTHTIRHRNDVIPLLDLRQLFTAMPDSGDSYLSCVILQWEGEKFGILADELIGQEKVLLKPINRLFINHPAVAGMVRLSAGEDALMLQTAELHRAIQKVHA